MEAFVHGLYLPWFFLREIKVTIKYAFVIKKDRNACDSVKIQSLSLFLSTKVLMYVVAQAFCQVNNSIYY